MKLSVLAIVASCFIFCMLVLLGYALIEQYTNHTFLGMIAFCSVNSLIAGGILIGVVERMNKQEDV